MTDSDRQKLKLQLIDAEAYRPFAYDDATGTMLKPGRVLRGNPTVGIGRNLLRPLSTAVIDLLYREDVEEAETWLKARYEWYAALSPIRQRCLIDLRFHLGAARFRKFRKMLTALAVGNTDSAADEIVDSALHPRRKTYLAAMMRDETEPPAVRGR